MTTEEMDVEVLMKYRAEAAAASTTSTLTFTLAVSPTLSPSSAGANHTTCGEQVFHSNGILEKVLIGGILTILTFLTICGNSLVIISVCVVKKLKQPSNYLIVSLAVADLSVAVAVMPFVSVTDLIGGRWIFGRAFCNVFIAMDVMCCTASIMTLCVISIDRYLGITRPLTYPVRQSGRCMARMVLAVWLLSASVTLPPLFGWAQNVNDGQVCLISQDLGYTVYSTAAAFYLPMAVMLIMYQRIYRAAKHSAAKHSVSSFPLRRRHRCHHPHPASGSSRRGEEEEEGEGSGGGGGGEGEGVDCVGVAMRLQRQVEECASFSGLLRSNRKNNMSIFKREQKAAATLGLVLGAFSVCWLPFFLVSTARPFVCGVECSCVPQWLERTLVWLGYANSLINPFIYALFNRDLRTTYHSILLCRYRNINRKLSAASMHEALRLAERHELVL